jgi:indoleacetamide hydrolase
MARLRHAHLTTPSMLMDMGEVRFMRPDPANDSSHQELISLGAAEAIASIRQGDITAERYVDALIAQYERTRSLAAITSIDIDRLRAAARDVDAQRLRGQPLGPLAGLPLAVKENINTAWLPTTAGTPALQGNVVGQDAPLLGPLYQAGAILFGKANMHELAFGITGVSSQGQSRNPYHTDMITGASSSGTAAAVAARVVPAGIGSDTGGSVRIPGALCGCSGFRPTARRYSNAGMVPVSHTRDTAGFMARSVDDICLLDSVLTGSARVQITSLAGLRVGVPSALFWEDLEPDLEVVAREALLKLQDAGVVLVETDVPGLREANERVGFPVAFYEAAVDLPAYLAAYAPHVGFDELIAQISDPAVKARLTHARQAGKDKQSYDTAMNVHRPQLQRIYADYFSERGLAAVVFPTTPATARPIRPFGQDSTIELGGREVDSFLTYIRNTDPGSNAGIPGLSLPAGLTSSGLPVGIEFDGPAGSDQIVLAIGLAAEGVLGRLPAPRTMIGG